jgi:diadenosine tetraphosphate (Ap4A) HIT family hydrolase
MIRPLGGSERCLLCDEMQNSGALSTRLGASRNDPGRYLLESRNFVLLSDISPLVPGHCLLVSRAHYPSFAQIPRELLPEFCDIRSRGISKVRDDFSPPLIFEHGSGSHDPKSGVCIQHAHMHLVPLCAPINAWMEDYGEVAELPTCFPTPPRAHFDYLYYEDQARRAYLLTNFDEPLPCQFIRRLLAKHFTIANWNWKSVWFQKSASCTSQPAG